jgi:hypothetical protein
MDATVAVQIPKRDRRLFKRLHPQNTFFRNLELFLRRSLGDDTFITK